VSHVLLRASPCSAHARGSPVPAGRLGGEQVDNAHDGGALPFIHRAFRAPAVAGPHLPSVRRECSPIIRDFQAAGGALTDHVVVHRSHRDRGAGLKNRIADPDLGVCRDGGVYLREYLALDAGRFPGAAAVTRAQDQHGGPPAVLTARGLCAPGLPSCVTETGTLCSGAAVGGAIRLSTATGCWLVVIFGESHLAVQSLIDFMVCSPYSESLPRIHFIKSGRLLSSHSCVWRH
jgi:hypothetical protein